MGIRSLSVTSYGNIETPDDIIPNIGLQNQTQSVAADMAYNNAGAAAAAGKTNNDQANKQKDEYSQLKNAIDAANNKLRFVQTRCEFKYYEDINRAAIKVIDKETDEVIREIPPEETIKLVQKLWELAGIIVDEKV